MTCVLSVTSFHTNKFSDETGMDLSNKGCDHNDFNWLDIQYIHAGLTNCHKCSITCRNDSNTDSSIPCRIQNGLSTSIKHVGNLDVRYEKDPEQDLNGSNTTSHINGIEHVNNQFEICYNQHGESKLPETTNHGYKRKADVLEFEDVYIPSKRVSPFLNTQKERKDVRKKLLKISVKKLKEVDDPEIFLRRTVLVNNTMKRLQTELRAENLRTKSKIYFSGYRTLKNNCLSNSYLFDDPFLSGVHEKITDDMTDTLIYNVFHGAQNDKTTETDEVVDSVK